ncbi:flagellar basal body rod protein FlgF [Acetobacter nitrogenifigens DSM 23921 = NBRC 105050]|uniref:Flagellar basal-body rod protein FlgF n=2 Tax=Acetobacter TaxID=434 RepID=A0A511X9F2_9PROT|nr:MULTISPECIES: flagellar basal-body rod protein FlgF [Acetobacter]MBO1360032.1 flagellar basal-body rod protein FlgF [Acetobacter sacchari]GBQ93474.1 flagellar basal body rod protein FlgF [Acetobacter nitrogenifigens DSM 23921 = NBRC 105050]GEN59575.1 flagellar basal-body rod protein FlgF [Acetobacter nitrogenifigens DSM 23921 = NBRC 105050]
MDNTTYIALSRIDTEMRAMSVLANNLSNASTPGFKASHVLFSDYLVKMKGEHTTPGAATEAYNQDKATYHDFAQGALQQTGNSLDAAITGDGYFSVMTRDGVRLTRNGRFQRLSDGRITDSAGDALLDRTGQPVTLQPTDRTVSIASDGTVSTENGVAAEIGVVTVDNAYTLVGEGSQLFRATTATRQMTNRDIREGMVEGSNVNSMTEMTQLVQLQRDFEFNTNLIESEATRKQNAIDKITQLQS